MCWALSRCRGSGGFSSTLLSFALVAGSDFRTILIMVARQNGKTSWVEFKNLWKMFVLGVALVIGTAQNLDVSEESWDKAVEFVESIPELAAELPEDGGIVRVNGKKTLKLQSGSRWKVAAASRRGGRGLSGDDVNLDELREHQNWDSWAAVTKTTLARFNAQVFAYSNAGDDKSVVLTALQIRGRAAAESPDDADPSLGHFEWSAPDHVCCDCHRAPDEPHGPDCMLRDRRFWRMANPSLGYTITEEALDSALATDPETVFRTECLCQHVPSLQDDHVIDPAAWAACEDKDSTAHGDVALCIDVTPRRDHASIGLYSLRPDGVGHIELIDYRSGVRWVVPALRKLIELHNPIAVGLDGNGPAAALLPDLTEAGIIAPEDPERPERGQLAIPTAGERAGAYGQMIDAVVERELRHRNQPLLNLAVSGAKTRTLGDLEMWTRRKAAVDITPLVAVTLARWAFVSRYELVAGTSYDLMQSFG
jgi:phage terminase large subunit-like protein